MKKQVARKEAPDSPEDAGMLAEQQPAQEVKPKAKPRAKKVVAVPEPEPVSAESSAEVEPAAPVKAKAAKKAAAKKAVSKKAVSAKTSPVEPAETAPETSADQDAEAPVVEAAPVSESAAPKTELAPKKSQAKKSKGRDLVAEVPAEAEVAEVLHEQPEAAAAESEIVPELEADETEEDEEPVQAPAREEHLERLQKVMAKAGVASRRAAEEMILAGRVQLNGKIVTELGTKADFGRDHIRVDGKLLHGPERLRYFVLNKPKGYVTTVSDPEGRPTVMQFFTGERERLYPVGRLDYLSEGLLLVTNDGELANKLTKAASGVEKTYLVKVAGVPTEEALDLLREGVVIERGRHGSNSGRVRTAPAQIRQVREGDNPWYEVVLIEGRNRELRKMFEEIGHHVEKIRRVGYGPLVLDQEPGKLRELEADEVHKLRLTAEGKLKPKRRRVPSVARLEPEAGRAVRFGKDDRRRAPARGGEFTAAPSRQSVRDVSTGIATGKRMAGSAPPRPAGRPDRPDRPARFDKPARPYKPGFDKSGFDKPRYDKPKFEKPGFDKPARSARPAKFDQPRQAERDSPQGRPAGRPMHIVAEGAEGAESPKKSFRPEAQKPFRPAAPKPDAPTKPPTGRERTGRHPREDDYVLTKTPGFRIEPVVEAPREQRPPRPAGAFRPSGERRPAASAGFKGAAKPFERKPSERSGERRAPEGRPFRPAGKPFRSADKPFRPASKPGGAGARPAGGRSASGDRPFRGPDKPFRSSDKPFRPSEKPFRSDDKPFRPSSRPAGTRPTGTRPAGTRPAGTRPAGARSGGSFAGSGRPAGRPRRDAEGGEGRPREFRPRTAPEGGRGFGDKPSRPAAGGPKREETGGGRVKNRWRNSFTGKNKGRPKPKPKKDS